MEAVDRSTAVHDHSALSRGFDLKWVIIGICVVLVAYIAVIPLFFLLWQSFFTPQTATQPAVFTLDNYRVAYSSGETARLFFNSMRYATGTSLLAFFIGTMLAWMNERTNTPFKTLFFALSLIPLIIPGILFTVAWILLGSPKIGLINLVLQNLFGTDYVFFNVYSMWGMIWVDGLHYSPMAFLIMTAAFAGRIGDDERGECVADRVSHHAQALVAGCFRNAVNSVRARHRIV